MSSAGIFEIASSGRARCRGCGGVIARGEMRFGEVLPNPFADGDLTVWFHPACAAWKRPAPLLEALSGTDQTVVDRESLADIAHHCQRHTRLPRVDGAEQAPSGRARCRHCRKPIARDDWRIRLTFHQDGQFAAGGFIHLSCRQDYFHTTEIRLDHVLHFSANLTPEERESLQQAWHASL